MMGCFSCSVKAIKWGIIITLVALAIQFWLVSKGYLFTEEAVAKIAKQHVGTKDVVKSYAAIHKEFQEKYPGHVLPASDLQWMFMNAGGWMGAMCIIHASLTEYVLFFGSAIDTEGHSGRYWANISDTLLTGEFNQWEEGKLTINTFKPGDTVLHPWGEVTAVNFRAGTWMVEYGRGFIPSTLGFALADTFFSTQDFVNLFYVLRIYSRAMVQEAMYYATHYHELWM